MSKTLKRTGLVAGLILFPLTALAATGTDVGSAACAAVCSVLGCC